MSIEAIKEQLRAIPEVAAWPEIAVMLDKPLKRRQFNCFDYPGIAARAVGGQAEDALPAATAIYCCLASIHLVDDILDEDPRGLYRTWGTGKAANLALALQAVASRVLAERAPAGRQALLQKSLAEMSFATAWGQQLDAEDRPGEAAYWETIRLKTPPLFGCALELGALLAGADAEQARLVAALGEPIGEMVQVNDDLHDALEIPACPDWNRQGGNLAILYARLAPHAARDRFEELRQGLADEAALREAQDLLIQSGAVSYCAYSLFEAHRKAKRCIEAAAVPAPAALHELADSHIEPLLGMLRSLGVQAPESLIRS
jgi:geranylgeranyl diphosphate synthase type I